MATTTPLVRVHINPVITGGGEGVRGGGCEGGEEVEDSREEIGEMRVDDLMDSGSS